MKSQDRLTVFVLIALFVALYMNWSWPWGLLFIYWAVPSYLNGEAFLVGPISLKENPILFWIITILWIVLGVIMILSDVAPALIKDIYV